MKSPHTIMFLLPNRSDSIPRGVWNIRRAERWAAIAIPSPPTDASRCNWYAGSIVATIMSASIVVNAAYTSSLISLFGLWALVVVVPPLPPPVSVLWLSYISLAPRVSRVSLTKRLTKMILTSPRAAQT